jgi:hypothetical protein
MPNDKTFSIPLHETWPVAPEPSCPGPWTGNQEPRHYRTIERGPTSCLSRCCGSICVGWFCSGRGPWTNGGGLLCLIPKAEPQAARPAHPHHRSPRLGPRPFSISVVNSFGGNFVWMHLYSRTNFKLNRAASLAEWRQLLSA